MKNAFGILAHRWRVFLTTIKLLLEKVTGNYICNLLFTQFDGLKKKQASYVSAANQEDCDHVLVQGPTTFHNATKKKKCKNLQGTPNKILS